ncbi:coiled-coil domain-containing protein 107 isoform X1 [Carcharodon carcharias]|uniref:coiled-coil domain-containing protein 107 isoform X1 n=2 Tax=Carcharodon carcharias TaxID=13397 RepID=UPI001B7F1906|nr:coiled-coil domain-containing protein 107 isoform X1 [Carcharodon carcharias]
MSLGQQAALALCLFICVFVLIPRLFPGGVGGGKEAAGRSAGHRPPVPGRGQPLIRHSQSNSPKGPPNLRMRSINQKEMNAEKTQGRNKGFAFQLMPLYAIGISIYAIYKLVQMKFNENEQSSNEKNKEVDKKRKNTETQLSELEMRLAQTERMLDSLVKELDPLTSCVDAVASAEKNEIMSQLLQLRQLVKERQAPNVNEEVTPVSENIKECVHDFEIKTPVSEDQASTDSGEDLVQDIDPITGNMLASSDFDEIEFGSSISTEDTEEDSEAVANLSETHEPMELRRRNKMNEFGK